MLPMRCLKIISTYVGVLIYEYVMRSRYLQGNDKSVLRFAHYLFDCIQYVIHIIFIITVVYT